MIPSGWKAAIIDIDRAVEFVGDDVDQYSSLVDLRGFYEFLTVIIPALDAVAVVQSYVQKDEKIATVPTLLATLDADATGHFAQATSSGAGAIAVTFRIGGVQYLRIRTAANQGADRVFYLQGFNRGE